ncbi:baseplate J/gp47 family protein [Desulfovibrio sp. JC010]|uniref:baseplate assembly protein n=1 Tax=Desulfovibrio sp. JC010 TaxID=2593641 RepID=UPI0013D12700|nr:baseplate assembly protein [Desulfovibrio sp. JC010]
MSIAAGFSRIDLAKLPAPQVVEELDFETIFQRKLAKFKKDYPEYSSIVESDPIYKILEEAAYDEMNLRQEFNDRAKSLMLAYAFGPNLDHLAALVPIERKLLDPGDPNAEPPIAPTYEGNDDFKARTQLAPEGFSVAGPGEGYRFHALKAAEVKDARSRRTAPGCIELAVLGRNGNGTPSAETITEVENIFSDRTVRPQGDLLTVRAAEIVEYEIDAVLTVANGPSDAVVAAAAEDAAQKYADNAHQIAGRVTLSGINAALTVAGVVDVQMPKPVESLACKEWQAPYCTAINIQVVQL